MGFFDKIFGSKAAATKFSGQKMTVLAPIDSTVIPLEQLPDETFATAILGPGCGLEPTGDMVYAPFDGTVTTIADTLHAVGLMSDDGIEVLIHVGMDTVEMQGKSFEAQVKVDQKVKAGTPLLKIHLDAISPPRRRTRPTEPHGHGSHRDQRGRSARNADRGRRHRGRRRSPVQI